jgi:dienelactone hydrolase
MGMEWSIRGLLNPVITRLLIYGVNPIDVEFVLSAVEKKNHINSHSLERSWLELWEKKATRYISLAEEAAAKENTLSAGALYQHAAQCYYAIFLINLSGIEDKKRVYVQYSDLYKKSLIFGPWHVEQLDIALGNGNSIPGNLYLPNRNNNEPKPCVIIYSGLGSCKEEMHTLAIPLVERGVAAFVPDMPGNGEALFMRNVKCRIDNLNAAFKEVINTLEKRNGIKKGRFGVYGLCMGGGYAYRAACMDSRYAACVTLFPLRVTQVAPETTPQWMKQGMWYNFQTGGLKTEEFMQQMKELEDGEINCPYMLIHGRNDNWMTLDAAMELYNNAHGEKEKIIIEEEPVFSNQQVVTHTMPVGEQLHWIRYVAADWLAAHL